MASPGPDRQAPFRIAAAGLLATFLFVLPFTSSAALRNALLALAALCVLYGVAKGAAQRPRLPPWRVLAPILAFCAWSAASVGWSVDPAYSISELRPGLLYPFVAFLVFFAVTNDATALDGWAWSLATGLAALGIAAAVQRMLAGSWDPQRWHGGIGSYATHVVLALPLLCWLFLRAGPDAGGRRIALAAIALLTLLVTSWNDNRIVWVALAGMTVLAVYFLRDALAGPQRARIVAFAVAAMIAFCALFAIAIQQRVTRLEGTANAEAAQLTGDPRLAIWEYAARRIADAPWVGHGYGRAILSGQFRTGAVSGADNPLHTHAHNTPLNVLVQGGAIGLALFAWMVAAWLREMAAGLRAGPSLRAPAALGIVLVAGFAIRNLTDDFLVRHNALLLWSLVGAVLGVLAAAQRQAAPISARTPA